MTTVGNLVTRARDQASGWQADALDLWAALRCLEALLEQADSRELHQVLEQREDVEAARRLVERLQRDAERHAESIDAAPLLQGHADATGLQAALDWANGAGGRHPDTSASEAWAYCRQLADAVGAKESGIGVAVGMISVIEEGDYQAARTAHLLLRQWLLDGVIRECGYVPVTLAGLFSGLKNLVEDHAGGWYFENAEWHGPDRRGDA